jgi:hypothetical protein
VNGSAPLGDIEDVPAFVVMIVRQRFKWPAPGENGNGNGRLPAEHADPSELVELDEVIAEGIAQTYDLYRRWKPERCERFSAYVLAKLPLRLIDWWRQQIRQSGHGLYDGHDRWLEERENGSRYVFWRRVSLDALREEDERWAPQAVANGGDFGRASGDPSLVSYDPHG